MGIVPPQDRLVENQREKERREQRRIKEMDALIRKPSHTDNENTIEPSDTLRENFSNPQAKKDDAKNKQKPAYIGRTRHLDLE